MRQDETGSGCSLFVIYQCKFEDRVKLRKISVNIFEDSALVQPGISRIMAIYRVIFFPA